MGPKQQTSPAPQQPAQGRPQPPQGQAQPPAPPIPRPKVTLSNLAADCLQIMDDPSQPEIVHRLAGITRQLSHHTMQIKAVVQELVKLRVADIKEIGEHFEQITSVLHKLAGTQEAGAEGQAPEGEGAAPQAQEEVPQDAPAGSQEPAQAAQGAQVAPAAAGPVPPSAAALKKLRSGR